MTFFTLFGRIMPELLQHLLGETIKVVSFISFFKKKSLKDLLWFSE